MTDSIPDEIMREADRIYGQLGRGVAADVFTIARALLRERQDNTEFDDGQPDEAQEWSDYDPDC